MGVPAIENEAIVLLEINAQVRSERGLKNTDPFAGLGFDHPIAGSKIAKDGGIHLDLDDSSFKGRMGLGEDRREGLETPEPNGEGSALKGVDHGIISDP